MTSSFKIMCVSLAPLRILDSDYLLAVQQLQMRQMQLQQLQARQAGFGLMPGMPNIGMMMGIPTSPAPPAPTAAGKLKATPETQCCLGTEL